MSPAASMPLCALERLSENVRMHAVWTRELSPVLPDTTALSAVALSGQALSDAARANPSVRVVLPRVLLKKAFAALAAEQGNAATLPVDAPGPTEGVELAVRLTLGRYDPVVAFSTTLMQMSSALAFNEAIESSRNLLSWLAGFGVPDPSLSRPLNVFSGALMDVCAMAGTVRVDLSRRLIGDCVWSVASVDRLSTSPEYKTTVGAFVGCSVNVQDICAAGQRAFLSNALVDAGLAELQQRCARESVPTGVLSCSQSASFTSIAGADVPLPRAFTSIMEVLDTWGPSTDRYVMLVNIGNTHWVSACVSLRTRSVTMYDSISGPSPTKLLIVSRLLLFARQATLRRRVTSSFSAAEEVEWKVDEVNQLSHQDGYNCGLFAVGYIWCLVYGQDFGSLRIVGDHLRLSLMHCILQCGSARAAPLGRGQGSPR